MNRSPVSEAGEELTELFGTWLAAHGTPAQIDSYNRFYEHNISPALSRRSLDNADGVDWGHVVNEWADGLTNCIQWFRNIRDGISSAQDAIHNVELEYERVLALSRAALSRPIQNAEAPAWRCAKCGCKSFSRADRLSDSGTKAFEPGPDVRCVECKDVSFYPLTPPAVTAGEAEPVAWRSLVGGVSLSSKPFPTAHPLYAAAPLPQVEADELQLLMRLRDNQQSNVHDVVEHDPDMWALGKTLSDRGLLAIASHPRGGIFHITRLGLAALTPQPGGE